MENPTCHFNITGSKNGDPQTQWVVKDDSDPAKTIRWEIVLGRGNFSLYREKFPEKRIQKISYIQIGLAVAIIILQILNMSLITYYTSVDSTAFWSSVLVVLAAVFTLKTSQQLTFERLCVCNGLQILASIFSLALVISLMIDSTSFQIHPKFGDYYDRDHHHHYDFDEPLRPVVTCLVFTGLALGSLSQLILCIYVAVKSASAICTRTCKFELKTLPMEEEEGGVNSQQNKYGLGLNQKKPPAYADISLEAHKMLSTSCPEI